MNLRENVLFVMGILLSFFLSACGNEIDSNMSEQVGEVDFNLMTQDEDSFSINELEGDWWIAYFMYTNCKIVCTTTTPHMVTVQDELKKDGLHPQIVAFSIDPNYDTPDVLKDYAHEYGADLNDWYFLTGYEFDEIQELSRDSFNTALEEGGPDDHQFVHSTSFFLVNPDGNIIKRYDGMSAKQLDLLVEDLRKAM